MTRDEHMQAAKDKALALVESGQVAEAFTSMLKDMSAHPDLASHQDDNGLTLRGMQLSVGRFADDPEAQADLDAARAEAMRAWIAEH